mgnify:CR=1 FL=1
MNLRESRLAEARKVLRTEEARAVFDQLCATYPDAAVFWEAEGEWVELLLVPPEADRDPTKEGNTVTITIE